MPEKGAVRYQYFIVDPAFKEDKWVRAAECRPGNRAVVHHIIVGIIPPGSVRRQKDIEGLHSEFLTATAPGAPPTLLREGQAKLIPAGSKLLFQLHYTPNGSPQADRSSVGLTFADPATVKQRVGTDKAATMRLVIPAGADNHRETASHRFSQDMLLLSLFPHMHLRGKAFRYTVLYPSGEQEVLLDVPHYDFNWQNTYHLAEPKRLPRGAVISCDAWYDNSKENLANPDPSVTVRWGDQTWEEMMIGYFDATPAEQDLSNLTVRRTAIFLDRARAGKLTWGADVMKLTAAALDADEKWLQLGLLLRQQLPQLDRICWTLADADSLDVRLCAQPPELEKAVGGKGKRVGARWMTLPRYAAGGAAVYHANLEEAEGIDLKYMSRAYGSSYHIPVKRAGGVGTLNFWSAEQDAFPPEAQKLLGELAAALFEQR